jgi:hypothetical protein
MGFFLSWLNAFKLTVIITVLMVNILKSSNGWIMVCELYLKKIVTLTNYLFGSAGTLVRAYVARQALYHFSHTPAQNKWT